MFWVCFRVVLGCFFVFYGGFGVVFGSVFVCYGCFGCGLTRSFVHTAHLDLGEAFRLHPLGPVAFLAVAVQIPWRLRKLRAVERPPRSE